MLQDLAQTIISLDDVSTMVASRALIAFLDVELRSDPDALRPPEINTMDLEALAKISTLELPPMGRHTERYQTEEEAAAAIGRGMFLLVLELGYADGVERACGPALLKTLSIGGLTSMQIISALATVIAWIPVERKSRINALAVVTSEGLRLTTEDQKNSIHSSMPDALGVFDQWWQSVS